VLNLAEVDLDDYTNVVVVDFEFQSEGGLHVEGGRQHGGRSLPLCAVFYELHSGWTLRLWRDQLERMRRAPIDTGRRTLWVGWFASAETGCFARLGWRLPERLICLHAEFRHRQNGIYTPKSPSLLDALAHFGIPGIGAAEKEANRDKILRTSVWSAADRRQTLDYCESDVRETAALFLKMRSRIDLPSALWRGRYSGVCGPIEQNGIRLDTAFWDRFDAVREPLLLKLIREVDYYQIYDGLVFKKRRFKKLVAHFRIPWEYNASGNGLLLRDDYFRDQAAAWGRRLPALHGLHMLRTTMTQMRQPRLAIGLCDGRNRTPLSPFGTVTGRNTPSNTKSIFGPARWSRFSVVADEGKGICYVDWSAQEIGIAGFLSNDPQLIATYLSGDPYIYFGVLIGKMPPGTVRGSTEVERWRDRFKTLFLGVNYGMGVRRLAYSLDVEPCEALELLQLHRRHYPVYWRWIERVLDNTDMRSMSATMDGWSIRVVDNVRDPDKSTRTGTLQNFQPQAHGATMMRLTAIALVEGGVEVAFPLHDAFLNEGPKRDIADIAQFTRATMERAGETMFGAPFRAKIHSFPGGRFKDDRPGSGATWARVNRLLRESEMELGVVATGAGSSNPVGRISYSTEKNRHRFNHLTG
jgi:hypothetical protein